MPAIAGIDIGSNALRLIVASVDQHRRMEVLERLREPVRLGQDVFTQGVISEPSIERALKSLERFAGVMNRHGVVRSKVVATSALRDAANREQFTDRVKRQLGIEISVIGAEEEARLIHSAVCEKVETGQKLALLVDIGGGSVEVTLTSDRRIISTVSFDIGVVRLMCELRGKKLDEREFNQMVHEYVGGLKKDLKKAIGQQKVDIFAGTGGNIESIGDLCKDLLGNGTNEVIPVESLNTLVKKLQSSSYEARIREMGLRPDRADVIVPAAIILQWIAKQAEISEILAPGVGVRDGLLIDVWAELYAGEKEIAREQALGSARRVGRKYAFDEAHAETVLRLAGMLFDATRDLHGLGNEQRILLEAAALLHDIGSFISISKHHKHTFYLLAAEPLVGLNASQQAIVANVARYHRMAAPNVRHEGFAALCAQDRVITSRLASLLRLADGMDTEHEARVAGFTLDVGKSQAVMRLHGTGDLLIEKWKLAKKCGLFEETYQLKLVIE